MDVTSEASCLEIPKPVGLLLDVTVIIMTLGASLPGLHASTGPRLGETEQVSNAEGCQKTTYFRGGEKGKNESLVSSAARCDLDRCGMPTAQRISKARRGRGRK
jgi:hypothetical protein